MCSRIPLWNSLCRAFICLGFLNYKCKFTTNDLSVQIVYSWFSFGRLYIARNLSISSRLSNCLCITNCSNFFWLFLSLWYQLFFPLFYFFLILILFCGWLSSFFLMVSLAKGLSILIIFSKSQLLPSLIFSIIFFYFIYFLSDLDHFLQSLLLLLF